MKFYVYQYLDPRTNLPFYVGKGTLNRMYVHLHETKNNTENKKKYAYIQGLRNKGLEPIVEKIVDGLDGKTAYDLEKELIKKYGRKGIDKNGILTNICEDNRPPTGRPRGFKHSQETKELFKQQRAWYKGKSYEERYGVDKAKEIKEKCKHIGAENGFYRKKHTLETRKIMSEKAKNRPGSRTGSNQSEEAKKKIQLNNPNRRSIHTPDGVFPAAEMYAKHINIITSCGLRNLLKNCDKPITIGLVAQNKLFTKDNIGKTPRELGYYYI